VGELSPGSELQSTLSTAHRLAWIENQAGKRSVRLDGKQQGGIYDDARHLQFTPDEQHLLFAAKRNSKWVLIRDGQEHSPEYSEISYVVFQPRGTAMAYCACQEKKCRLVVDGSPTGAEYEDITHPQYTRDGKRLAYLGKQEKKWLAVVDGKQLGPEVDKFYGYDIHGHDISNERNTHAQFDDWGFSWDSSRSYVAAAMEGKWMYVIDGAAGPGFDVVSPVGFSSDGKHYAYAGTQAKFGFSKEKTFGTLVLDGEAKASFEGKGFGGFWKEMGTRQTEYIVRGVLRFTPDFHGLSGPQFTFEGKLVYAARRSKGDAAVFVGEEAGPGFDEIASPIVFTRDAKHFAYIAQQGEDFVEVRDNRPGAKFLGKRKLSFVSWIAMTDDAAHLAYEIVRGGETFKAGRTSHALRRVVIDGQAGPEYDADGLYSFRFTKDFAHYGYEVHRVEGKHDRVVVDGHESKLYESVFRGSLAYAAGEKTFSFVAQDGQKLLRVTFPTP